MEKKKNIVSLFDGMSCCQIALNKLGIKYQNYYASEVDKHAIKVTMANYPNTIQLGDVRNVTALNLPEIYLLAGGSPCQSFSFAGKRKGMSTKSNEEIHTLERYLELKNQGFEFEGQSYLFWEYVRILKEVKPKYFILENVLMEERWKNVISKALGVKPIMINASRVSAQNRKRLFWTNIGMEPKGLFGDMESIIQQPKDRGILLKDILEIEVDEKYYLSDKAILGFLNHQKPHKERGNGFGATFPNEKAYTLNQRDYKDGNNNLIKIEACVKFGKGILEIPEATQKGFVEIEPGECFDFENPNSETRRGRKMNEKSNTLMAKKTDFMHYTKDYRIRRLTPTECERLQCVPDGYTSLVSDIQRYKMLGNGWNIEVIAHIFNYLK